MPTSLFDLIKNHLQVTGPVTIQDCYRRCDDQFAAWETAKEFDKELHFIEVWTSMMKQNQIRLEGLFPECYGWKY